MNLFKKRKSITSLTDPLFLGINLQEEIYLRSFTIYTAPIFKYLDISSSYYQKCYSYTQKF